MPAAGGDIDAAPLAHRAGQSVGEQDVLKFPRSRPARGLTRVALGGVERDEVHLRRDVLEQAPEGMGVIWAVVAAFDECPLEEDPATQLGGVLATGFDEFVQRPLAGHGNEGRALGLGGPVQRDGQTHRLPFGRQSTDPRYHAHGGHGDLVGPQRQPGRIPQDVDGLHHGVVVVQWFAHAHEDDVAQPLMPVEHRGVIRVG